MTFKDIRIIFMDGEIREFNAATSIVTTEGILRVHQKDGEFAPTCHLGSFPIVNIRAFYTRPTFPNSTSGKEAWPE